MTLVPANRANEHEWNEVYQHAIQPIIRGQILGAREIVHPQKHRMLVSKRAGAFGAR